MMSKKKVYVADYPNYSFTKAIRQKCLDCAGTSDNVRDCHICKCPLWAVRFGRSPSSAAYQLAKTYDVALVEVGSAEYIEELKGKRLKRPSKNPLLSD